MKPQNVSREIERMTENRKHYTNTDNPVDFPITPETMRARCEALITAMVGKELAPKWWTSPSRAFGDDTPEQIYSVAPSAVYAYLMRSADGEW